MAISLLDLLTGAAPFQKSQVQCVYDEALSLRFAAAPKDFGRKWSLLETERVNASEVPRALPKLRTKSRSLHGRPRCDRLKGNLGKVLQRRLFPFQVGRLSHVLLDHLERIFDLALVYHDFYAGALSEHGGPLRHRASLVKKLSEFVIGEEGDAEGYAYPQDPADPPLARGAISPTSSLELVGNFFYHAHGREQCAPHDCGNHVPVLRFQRVAPLHMRKAFCNYYHFTTVALARLVALLPWLKEDESLLVLIPHPNKKGQQSAYIRESLRLLGLSDERVLSFPPCRLVLAEEVLLGGAGPRSSFGRDHQGRARAIMADVADEQPSRRVRHAFLALNLRRVRADLLLIDRHERRRIENLPDVVNALEKLPGRNHTLIYCENLTFTEQVSMFASANAVVAVSGACLANSLYMRENALVVELVPVQNYMGADVVMPLHCGITWFWTLSSNVPLLYRSLMLPEGDLEADSIQVPASELRRLLLRELGEAAEGEAEDEIHSTPPPFQCEEMLQVVAPGLCARMAGVQSSGKGWSSGSCQEPGDGYWK
eukprot:s1371_g7.t2